MIPQGRLPFALACLFLAGIFLGLAWVLGRGQVELAEPEALFV